MPLLTCPRSRDARRHCGDAWQADDLVLWDNLRMLHQACGVPPGEEREVWRTTLAAPYPLARKLEDGGFAWKSQAA